MATIDDLSQAAFSGDLQRLQDILDAQPELKDKLDSVRMCCVVVPARLLC